METIAKIRRLHYVEGQGYKTIARELRLSKHTVKKVIRSQQTAFHYERQVIHRPVLGPYIAALEGYLKEDGEMPKRRRRTAKKLYETLKAQGFKGSYDIVADYVKRHHEQKKETLPAVFIPLQFAPGEAFQFDWSEEEIELSGELTRIKVAHIRLCYSRYFLMVAYPNEQLEMVLDAHDKAFAFFGGTCLQGTYDNMKTAVKQIFIGKAREFNPRFLQMASHYCFEPVACTPAAGWEKGQVENQVATGRENFFTPLQRVKSLAELNDKLKAQCIAWAKSQAHPEFKDKTVWEVYEQECSALIPYSQAFAGYKVQKAVVSPSSMVRVETNDYSVDCHYVGKVVEVQISAHHIGVTYQQQEIAHHIRCFKRYQRLYNPWHYVPALARKPGALRHGAPFKQLELPASIMQLKDKFVENTDKQFATVLLLIQSKGLEKVAHVCQQALSLGIRNVQWIKEQLAPEKRFAETLYFPEISQMPEHCDVYDKVYRAKEYHYAK